MKRKILTILLAYIPAGFVMASVLLVILLRWVPVGVTPLMLKRSLQKVGDRPMGLRYEWVPLEEISDDMVAAVLAAEDGSFYSHDGFDFEEMRRMRKKHLRGDGALRGCSTISQQTAKNCFTWCSQTWVRKAFETYFTVLIERLWGKERILEVYLNVAELGPGIYGCEAAAKRYFHLHASQLNMADASALACCLPNPLHRSPQWVNTFMSAHRAKVALRAKSGRTRPFCKPS